MELKYKIMDDIQFAKSIVERLSKDIEAHFTGWRKELRTEFNLMQNNLLERMKKQVYTFSINRLIIK